MISLEWVKDYIDLDGEDPKELAVKVTKAGINVERVVTNDIKNLVIGEVKECNPHPDSDHLHVCMVDTGKEVLQIVCGAENVRKGIKVILALPGAVLPGGEIKKSVIRGVESNGMICALFELGLEEKTEENYAKGIAELPDDAPIGEEPLHYLHRDTTLYELDVHKHRNNDCYYHIGFAYEIAAILNKKVHLPEIKYNEVKENVKDNMTIQIDTEMCPYYSCKMVKDVKIKESPDFIQRRLLDAGMRPINNVVDISNYVMLEFGQPLHFFDYKKLGNRIVVRQAKDDEPITTLDEKDRVLSSKDIVITDGNKPVCIAGVMGGLNTDVDETTKDILIESAIFDAVSIRNTASRLDLKSEASIRYGKGLSPEYTHMAIERACQLLEEYADGKVLSGELIHDKTDHKDEIVEFKAKDVCNMLGIEISEEDMEHELNRLDFAFKKDKDKFIVTIPKRRLDIDPNVNDIAEEIGRLYGYQNLKSTLPVLETRKGVYVGDVKIRKSITRRLRSLGLNEAKTYTLVNPEMAKMFKYEDKELITLPNPLSVDKSVIRGTILPSLLNAYNYNKARKVEDINLYEIGKTYGKDYNEDVKVSILMSGNLSSSTWSNNNLKVDFYTIKGVVENLLEYLGFHNRYKIVKPESSISGLHPGICAKVLLDNKDLGVIGQVHPSITKDKVFVAELSMTKLDVRTHGIDFIPGNKYPEIVKDAAFIVDKSTSCDDIVYVIRRNGGKNLEHIEVFDLYEGDNLGEDKKSIAFSLTYANHERTLSDEEVMQDFNKVTHEVVTKCNAVLRDK